LAGDERAGAWRLPQRIDRERSLSFVDSFVAPRPNMKLIRVMTAINRVFMLKGMPLLRDLPPFSKVPPFRGLANIRHLDFPAEDQARLAAVCGTGKATFIAPNHPEFFTDWMIDKEIIARVSPLAAAWATHGVVNGLGRLAQRFWLANNLIAQIPGNSAPARAHSVAWAIEGHGVLLHPEGAVGWHNNHVAALMPGAVAMGLEALATGRKTNPGFQAWVAPVVWKLAFIGDVEKPLLAECAYVEGRLKIGAGGSRLPLADRVYRIYALLLARDESRLGLTVDSQSRFAERQPVVIAALSLELRRLLDAGTSDDPGELLRLARRRLRDRASLDPEAAKALRSTADSLARVIRIGPFAFAKETVTQEELAEHLKRIRNDYCAGSLRDTLNRFLPQPAGPRRAHIRVPEPLGLHEWAGTEDEALAVVRGRMQAALDAINAGLRSEIARPNYPNPFHHRQFANA
jgi:hypothetical protein